MNKITTLLTAAALATQLQEAQKKYQLERTLAKLDKVDLLICDELGYLSFSRAAAELLAAAYHKSLQLAVENGCQSIALPLLSTGAYRYPIDQASRVALATAIDFLTEHGRPALIRFVAFDDRALTALAEVLDQLSGK